MRKKFFKRITTRLIFGNTFQGRRPALPFEITPYRMAESSQTVSCFHFILLVSLTCDAHLFTARQRKPKEADVVSTVTNPQNFLPSLCSYPPTWASSLSRRTGNDLTLYKLTSLCMFSVLFFTHFLSSNKENL